MSDYPFHMRRSRRPRSTAQHERFKAEQAAARRDLLTQLIRDEVQQRGTAGYDDIERWAFEALYEAVDQSDSFSVNISRSRTWGHGECHSESEGLIHSHSWCGSHAESESELGTFNDEPEE